jgi:hypothetical protein
VKLFTVGGNRIEQIPPAKKLAETFMVKLIEDRYPSKSATAMPAL